MTTTELASWTNNARQLAADLDSFQTTAAALRDAARGLPRGDATPAGLAALLETWDAIAAGASPCPTGIDHRGQQLQRRLAQAAETAADAVRMLLDTLAAEVGRCLAAGIQLPGRPLLRAQDFGDASLTIANNHTGGPLSGLPPAHPAQSMFKADDLPVLAGGPAIVCGPLDRQTPHWWYEPATVREHTQTVRQEQDEAARERAAKQLAEEQRNERRRRAEAGELGLLRERVAQLETMLAVKGDDR